VERAALRRRLTWQLRTVIELIEETSATKSIALDLPDWSGHRAGQHVDVRLTAEIESDWCADPPRLNEHLGAR
jgi:ferredoxin-NADP reductase